LNDILIGAHPKIGSLMSLPTQQNTEIAILRESIVDVLCQYVEGKQYIIEMQCTGDEILQNAPAEKLTRLMETNISRGSSNLKLVILLPIMKAQLFLHEPFFLSHYMLQDIDTCKSNIEKISYSFLELGKINKIFEESKTVILKCAYFFKYVSETTGEELKEITRHYLSIGRVYNELEFYNYSPEEMDKYYCRDMNADAITTGSSDAEERGLTKSLVEGLAQVKRDMVLGMYRQGIDKRIIVEVSQLSFEEIDQILSEAELNEYHLRKPRTISISLWLENDLID
jgi:predicted transposase/invertase (TIGR01784 family)